MKGKERHYSSFTMPRQAEQIILSSLDFLWGMARRLGNGHEEAEDLVQETCLRAIRHPETLARHPNPKAYLLRTLKNLFTDHCRAKGKAPRIVSIEELRNESAEPMVPDRSIRWIPTAIKESLSENVQQALDSLPEEMREVLWLREVEEFTYRDIAEALGIPIGTVRSRLARAREHLAASLSPRQAATKTDTLPAKEVRP